MTLTTEQAEFLIFTNFQPAPERGWRVLAADGFGPVTTELVSAGLLTRGRLATVYLTEAGERAREDAREAWIAARRAA